MPVGDPSPDPAPRPPSRPWLVLLSVAMVGVSLAAGIGAGEIVLRLAHFRFRAIPEVQFGWPDPQVLQHEFLPDPDVVWVTRDYPARIERARQEHAQIIFLGDSCVEYSGYPRRALARLAQQDPALAIGEKLGVPGWSSEQGRVQMARDVTAIRPRVVTVEFGWNDHWDALGPPDDQVHSSAVLLWLSEHSRVYQAYRKAVSGIVMKANGGARRVSLERYRQNLRAIAAAAAAVGTRVVFITAPSNHAVGHEPAYLAARHLRDVSQLVPLHTAYVEATRDAASAPGASLCDAAAAVASLGDAKRFLFHTDGIHFTEPGDQFMADFVAACIQTAVR